MDREDLRVSLKLYYIELLIDFLLHNVFFYNLGSDAVCEWRVLCVGM